MMPVSPAIAGDWQPVQTEAHDDLTAAPLRRLAALLDHDGAHWRAGVLPPLGHWLYFLPEDRQSALGPDGHPRRGAALPPIDAARRMWAGSRLTFHAPLPVGARAVRRSMVAKVAHKEGRSGKLSFVTVRHEISVDGVVAVTEDQDLVYRDTSGMLADGVRDVRASDASRSFLPDSRALFRFSALTNNAHRIHYDLDYATGIEGYPGLVVHGPYQAMLLVDLLLREKPGATLATFAFRGVLPMFADGGASVHLAGAEGDIRLWTRDSAGVACMEASATLS